MKKRGLSLILATIFTFTLVSNNSFQENKEVKAVEGKEIYSNGYKAPKIKVNRSSEKPIVKSSILPSKYDSRDFGYVTAVKNQGQIGDCWAFTTYGALDSVQKKNTNKDYDFSEIHLATNNGIGGADDGGNMYYSISYFMKGKGPVLEKDDPYPNPAEVNNINSNSNAPVNYTVDDVSLLPDRTSAYDNNYIKENVMKYGGVYTSIHLEGYNYDIIKDNKYLYVPEGTYSYANHAVVIVGWDDNFPKENFPTLPSGNGAFICKNSWGEGFGDNGYIYVSYYDTIVGTDSAVIPTLTKKSQYDKRNSYGDNFPMYAIGTSYESSYAASTYTASENQYVNSIGVFSNEQDITYDLYIEEDYGTNKFTNILNKKVKTIKIHDAGFHTIKLDTPVKISAGKTYAVAFRNNAKGLFVEPDTVTYPYENNNFISFGGQSWMSGYDGVFIVANTTKVPQYPITGISLDKSNLSLGYNGKYKLSATIMPQNADNKTIYWTSNNPSVATVDEDGNVTGMRNGSAVITAATIDGKVKASTNVTVSNALTILNFSGQDEYTVLTANPVWTLRFNDLVVAGPSYNNIYVIDSSGRKSLASVAINYNQVNISVNTSDFNGGAVRLVVPKDAFVDSTNSGMSSQLERNYCINYKAGIKVDFKDGVLEKAVRDSLGKTTGDIYSEDMAKLTSLRIENESLWSLSGIEYAVNLNDLSIYNTEIIDITPVSNLFSLEHLYLSRNNVNSLKSISNLHKLQRLYIEDENIKDFSVISTIGKLYQLTLNDCNLSNINFLSNLTNLEYLELNNNYISDISQIGALKKLSIMDLEGNQIKDISPLLQLPTEQQYYDLYGTNSIRRILVDKNLVFNSSDSTSSDIKTKLEDNGWNFYAVSEPKGNLNIAKVDERYYSEYSTYKVDSLVGFSISFNSNIQSSLSFSDIKLRRYYSDQYISIDKTISGDKITIKVLEPLDSQSEYVLEVPDAAVIDSNQNGIKQTSIKIAPLDYLKGDSNEDGKVDALDLAIVASHYNEMSSSSAVKWDLKKDWNKDGIIDIFDITTVARHIQ
ncbi:Ig-like domain-containing protein [Clostridium sp. YIM B02505]|uniref:Ig-like domain-containing protein n=1 Tax=Clostridium yunnanense TaxID=2800325 RepID=A0ABS1EWZ9_9CLOT|nr:C1 family peptidase [Clostridium yunnanense]MBK1813865.1 Ig-like domain-containing protein [Clostridium yunnanense]